MRSIESLLADAFTGDMLTLPETFQGLPGMAHGGSVLAAFDSIATRAGASAPRDIFGAYRRKVALNTSLPLEIRSSATGVEFHLSEGENLLVEGSVRPAAPPSTRPALPRQRDEGSPLPISDHCFACGTENLLGLQVGLRFDEQRVWIEYLPREPFRTNDGRVATAALTTLLDEAAFWLGALATGESGMTTELRVTLHRPQVEFGKPLIVLGSREQAVPRTGDERYWETTATILSTEGNLVASARITFVAVRGAAKRLIAGILKLNPPEILRRIFPAYS